MIIDKILNWETYNFPRIMESVFDFLKLLSPDSDEKRYTIQGDDIFALVMSYNTQQPATAKLESHRKYVDIQTVLVGAEGIEWFPRDMLEIETPYNEINDVEFYKHNSPSPSRIDVLPGTFVVLYPHDAHMPSLEVAGKSDYVKKVVIKIKVELLTYIPQ